MNHNTIKTEPFEVKSSTYINSSKEMNDEDSKFKIGDIVRISKYKNLLAKGSVTNLFQEDFVIKKVKNNVPWTYVISDRNGEKIVGTFYKKELQKTNQKEFRAEKVIKREKVVNCKLNRKVTIVLLTVGLIKR